MERPNSGLRVAPAGVVLSRGTMDEGWRVVFAISATAVVAGGAPSLPSGLSSVCTFKVAPYPYFSLGPKSHIHTPVEKVSSVHYGLRSRIGCSWIEERIYKRRF